MNYLVLVQRMQQAKLQLEKMENQVEWTEEEVGRYETWVKEQKESWNQEGHSDEATKRYEEWLELVREDWLEEVHVSEKNGLRDYVSELEEETDAYWSREYLIEEAKQKNKEDPYFWEDEISKKILAKYPHLSPEEAYAENWLAIIKDNEEKFVEDEEYDA